MSAASMSMTMGSCASKTLVTPARSTAYNCYIGCGRPIVTGKRAFSARPLLVLDRQQRRMGHSWISGHPHSILYKPTSSAGSNGSASAGPSTHGSSSSNLSSGSSSSFLEFAGNGRYQAYTLARFSTLSAVSSSASSTSSTSSTSTPTTEELLSKSPEEQGASGTFAPGSGQQGPQDSQSPTGVSQSHADTNSKPASDGQSPTSSFLPQSSAPQTSTSDTSTSSTSSDTSDDKDDAWAVNESYSGHGGGASSSSTAESSSLGSQSFNSNSSNGNSTTELPTRIDVESAVSPSKSPADIEASWRRTSDSIPSPSTSSSSPSLSSGKPGSLDLSSSTLVQQMLFKEPPPHTIDNNNNWKQSDEGNSRGRSYDTRANDEVNEDDEDDGGRLERKHSTG